MSEFSIVGLIADASKTMGDALVQLNRYGRLVIEVDTGATDRFRVVAEGERHWLVDTRNNPNGFPELAESTFARIACHSRLFGTQFGDMISISLPLRSGAL